MPQIPTRREGQQVQFRAPVRIATATQFGAEEGRALQRFGQNLSQAGFQVASFVQAATNTKDDLFIQQMKNSARIADAESANFAVTSGEADFAAKEVVTFVDVYNGDFAKKRQDALEAIEDSEQKQQAGVIFDTFQATRTPDLIAKSTIGR